MFHHDLTWSVMVHRDLRAFREMFWGLIQGCRRVARGSFGGDQEATPGVLVIFHGLLELVFYVPTMLSVSLEAGQTIVYPLWTHRLKVGAHESEDSDPYLIMRLPF